MVIDIDGRFYHGDGFDYNGKQSKEEYDEKRFISTPDNIKVHIIYETHFRESFDRMIQLLMRDNYGEILNDTFKACRDMEFPPYKYTETQLLYSYRELKNMDCQSRYSIKIDRDSDLDDFSINVRFGDALINHFHRSILWAKCKSSNVSPHDAWFDDRLLMDVIKNRIIYVNVLNPNKILQGFNISRIAQKVSVFSAGRAKMIIHKYLNEYDTIFDPFSGFSGRMLGCISLGKKYIGQDISPIHIEESNRMAGFLAIDRHIELTNVDILSSHGSYPCLFTCPPYGDKEQWLNVPVSSRSCDDWIDECLKRFKCERYVFVVDNTKRYSLYITGIIRNKSHLNQNNEYIIVI
jgi:hypothetical protein